MTPQAVRQALLEDPEAHKEVRLNDGTRVLVRNREQWIVSPDYLNVLVGRYFHLIAFRNIAAIRILPPRRRK